MSGRKEKSYRSKKLVQSRLKLDCDRSPIVKCEKCEMSYMSASMDDIALHSKYHGMMLKGRHWSSKWGERHHVDQEESSVRRAITPPMSSPIRGQTRKLDVVVKVRRGHTSEVNAMLEIMGVVNRELNAPHDENEFWSSEHGETRGNAFVYVRNERAIGAITMEVLKPERCRWMVYESRAIVEPVQPVFKIGVSRIWVCKSYRGEGIASTMIDIARRHTIPGINIPKNLVAWSQPTNSGGKLARKYNGAKHKSGNILIPCYL
ncbi:N-acetyltransferase ECO1 [Nakaseomyces bracarensis]|uniref:N-acetyltransferase ECO1 n=1 Tax=Nakaseomyces bracarensis TaxID=273131 RepID=A0ABR4NP23_9SACH